MSDPENADIPVAAADTETVESASKKDKQPKAFDDGPDYVQSLARGLDVICAFSREAPAMSLSEVAEITGLSRAVVRRSLLTLSHLGYVAQRGRLFYLTPRILNLGYRFLSSLDFTELAMPFMEDLSRRINESCSMSILDKSEIVYVVRVPVRKVITVSLGVGARLPAFCTSMGRVLWSGLANEDLEAELAQLKPEAFTAYTKIAPQEIRAELLRVKEQNYAYVEQELELGLCSIAVPIRNRVGKMVTSLNVGMPFRDGARDRAMQVILPALRDTARQIEQSTSPGWVGLRP